MSTLHSAHEKQAKLGLAKLASFFSLVTDSQKNPSHSDDWGPFNIKFTTFLQVKDDAEWCIQITLRGK